MAKKSFKELFDYKERSECCACCTFSHSPTICPSENVIYYLCEPYPDKNKPEGVVGSGHCKKFEWR